MSCVCVSSFWVDAFSAALFLLSGALQVDCLSEELVGVRMRGLLILWAAGLDCLCLIILQSDNKSLTSTKAILTIQIAVFNDSPRPLRLLNNDLTLLGSRHTAHNSHSTALCHLLRDKWPIDLAKWSLFFTVAGWLQHPCSLFKTLWGPKQDSEILKEQSSSLMNTWIGFSYS